MVLRTALPYCTNFLNQISKCQPSCLLNSQKSEREDRESIMVRENGGRERERKEERERVVVRREREREREGERERGREGERERGREGERERGREGERERGRERERERERIASLCSMKKGCL